MGCDIHIVVERKLKGSWVPVNPEPDRNHVWNMYSRHHWGRFVHVNMMEELAMAMEEPEDRVPSRAEIWYFPRCYESFAQLAGVRGEDGIMKDPEGLPDDMSIQTWRMVMTQIVEDDPGEEGQDLREDTSYMTRAYVTARGRDIVERDGVEWARGLDWHTPSYYTLADLREGIVANDADSAHYATASLRDLESVLAAVAAEFGLSDDEVRTVFWFDN